MSKAVMVRVVREFGREWNMHRVGEVMEMDGGIREIYLRRGFVEIVEPVVETAALTTKKRRRRRQTRAKTQ